MEHRVVDPPWGGGWLQVLSTPYATASTRAGLLDPNHPVTIHYP